MIFRKIVRLIGKLLFLFVTSTFLVTLLYRFIPVPVTPLMLIRCVEQFQNNEQVRLRKDWVPMDKISKPMQLAVLCSEDQNFLNHYGFDLKAIEKAMEGNKKGKRIKGASTISQQTAKNVFLWPGRTWLRKGLEVYFTGLIELLWSKQRILEVYLNVIEVGNGIYGVEAGAQQFYKKSAHAISQREAAGIAAVLPNPRKYAVTAPTPYLQKRKRWIITQMNYWNNEIDWDSDNEKP